MSKPKGEIIPIPAYNYVRHIRGFGSISIVMALKKELLPSSEAAFCTEFSVAGSVHPYSVVSENAPNDFHFKVSLSVYDLHALGRDAYAYLDSVSDQLGELDYQLFENDEVTRKPFTEKSVNMLQRRALTE